MKVLHYSLQGWTNIHWTEQMFVTTCFDANKLLTVNI